MNYGEIKNFDIANGEGVRVSLCDGWFLLRLSVHDPVMPLNIESNSVGGCDVIWQQLLQMQRRSAA